MNAIPQDARAAARRRILVFVTITLLLSIAQWALWPVSEVFAGIGVVTMMWTPAIAAFATQLVSRRKLAELGWRRAGKPRYLILSATLPIGFAVVTYGASWITGLAGLQAQDFISAARGYINDLGIGVESPGAVILLTLLGFSSIGLLFATTLALGEEIGWRGFLVPELSKVMPFTGVALLSGAIWAVWHWPMILFFGYRSEAPVWYGLVLITVDILAGSFLLAWFRLKSGSVWTAALLHGSHNIFVQELFDKITTDTGITKYIVGEFGCAHALLGIAVAYICWRLRWRLPEVQTR